MPTFYLDEILMEKMCHRLAVAVFDKEEEPIASFYERDPGKLNSALNLPRQSFGGKEFYPTLIDKATILFYVLNKSHIFLNGNKRISAASLMVFLYINDMWLDAGKTEIVEKTLDIAKSEPARMDEIIIEIRKWISDHAIPLKNVR